MKAVGTAEQIAPDMGWADQSRCEVQHPQELTSPDLPYTAHLLPVKGRSLSRRHCPQGTIVENTLLAEPLRRLMRSAKLQVTQPAGGMAPADSK